MNNFEQFINKKITCLESDESLHEGHKVTLKRRYTENYPAITAGKHARIRNKMLETIGDGKITQNEFDNILKELSSNNKKWMRTNLKYFNVSEDGISLTKFGQRALASITVNEEQPEINKKPLEMKINESKFKVDDLVYNKRTKTVGIVRIGDDKYGEVKTDADGNVNVDELEKYNPIKFKHQSNAKAAPSTQKEVSKRGLFNPFKNESVVNESTNEGLNYKKLAKQFVNDEWLDVDDNIEDLDADEYFDDKLNAFNREELGNSEEFDNNKINMSIEVKKLLKGRLKQIFEATTKNPEVWVPGAFDKELSKMPNSKITYNVVKDLAKKHKVFLDDAIAYVEYGWDIDLNENNNNNMKTNFIYESFNSFVKNELNENNELNEAFASAKLASILTGANKMDKDLPKAFYNMAKIALDKIQDVDIIEMTPEQARKEKRSNAVYLYFTTNEKENPYAGSDTWRDEKTIPGNTLLAITDGSNEWMATEWQKTYSRDKKAIKTLKTAKRDDSAGFPKSGANSKYGSGISSMKQVVDLADRAYCLDLDILRARYSTTTQRDERVAAQKGAIAFKTNKEFKAENLNRYNNIIANRAAEMPIDKMVLDAIDTISNQIKDALAKGEKTRYGDILIGRTPKGREAKISDAANHMQRILDDFQRYVQYTNQAEEEKNAGYNGEYYAREVKNSAKNVTDRIKQIDNFSYAW